MDVIGHFGLGHDPFRAAVEPEQAFESGPFVAARQQVMGALLRGARLIAVVGGAGAGKSLLLRAIEKTAIGGRGVMRVERADLAEAALASDNRVLLLDDADALGDAAFARLAERTNEASGPRVILACERHCLERLPPEVAPTVVRLPYLNGKEARLYLIDRVERAGRADLLSDEALGLLIKAGQGIPGALRVLGANALFHAAFAGAPRVEEAHARQAADMLQAMWQRPVEAEPARTQDPVAQTAIAAAAAAPLVSAPAAALASNPDPAPAATIKPERFVDPAPAAEADVPERRSWWRSVPPLARLGIVVGMLLLSLPMLGYLVGAIKDDRPATESSYLPDDNVVDEDTKDTAAQANNTATEEEPIVTADASDTAPPPAEAEPADVGPPQDLTPPVVREEEEQQDMTVGQGTAVAAPQPEEVTAEEVPPTARPENVAPAAARPRVFVHYSRSQPGGSEAAEEVARALRDRGFEVVDIRDVPGAIGQASVRYFYLADREAAEALHDALGDVLRDRGFSAGDLKAMTDYRPLPRLGTVEVWVPVAL